MSGNYVYRRPFHISVRPKRPALHVVVIEHLLPAILTVPEMVLLAMRRLDIDPIRQM